MFKEVPFCKPIISWELGMSTLKWGSTKMKRKTEKKTPYVIIQYPGIMIHYDLVYCPCLYCHSLCVVYLVKIDFVHFFDCLLYLCCRLKSNILIILTGLIRPHFVCLSQASNRISMGIYRGPDGVHWFEMRGSCAFCCY